MKNISICLLISVLLVPETKATCAEWKQLESDCGSYCLKVLRPVLDHTRALQSQVNDFKHQTESLKVINEKSDVNDNRLEQKLEDLRRTIDIALLKQTESNNKQNGDFQWKFQNIDRELNKIDALETKLDHQSKLTEATLQNQTSYFVSKFQNIEQLLKEKFEMFAKKEEIQSEVVETGFQKESDYLKQSIKQLQERIDVLETKLDPKFDLIGKVTETTLQKHIENLKIKFDPLAKIENIKSLQEMLETLQGKLENLHRIMEVKKSTVGRSFQKIGSKYYYIEQSEKLNWFGAVHKCVTLGGHLVSIKNLSEFNAIIAKLQPPKRYWIDINDLATEGVFVSATTGLNATYYNWHNGDPDNYWNDEDCGSLFYASKKYLMNDEGCHFKNLFICEPDIQ